MNRSLLHLSCLGFGMLVVGACDGVEPTDTSPDTAIDDSASCPVPTDGAYDGELDALVGTWYMAEMCTSSPMPTVQALCNGESTVTGMTDTNFSGVMSVSTDHTYVVNAVHGGQVEVQFPSTCLSDLGGDCAGAEDMVDDLLRSQYAQGTLSCVDEAGGCRCTFDGELRMLRAGALTSDAAGEATGHSFEGGTVETSNWLVGGGDTPYLHEADGEESWSAFDTVDENYDRAMYCAAFMHTCNDAAGVAGYADYADCFSKSGTLTRNGSPQTTGDSFECRYHHVLLAADATDSANRETHCPHAQFEATAPCVD